VAKFSGVSKGVSKLVSMSTGLVFAVVDGAVSGLKETGQNAKDTTTGKALVGFFEEESK
jgi:hypothetical protein